MSGKSTGRVAGGSSSRNSAASGPLKRSKSQRGPGGSTSSGLSRGDLVPRTHVRGRHSLRVGSLRVDAVTGELLGGDGGAAPLPPVGPAGADYLFINRNKSLLSGSWDPSEVEESALKELEVIERQEVERAAEAGRFSELESRRLRLMHACRIETLHQVGFIAGRARELDRQGRRGFEFSAATTAAGALLGCAAHLVFDVNREHDFARLQSGRFCRNDKLCATCARLRSAHLVRDYGGRAGAVLDRHRDGVKVVHVVLTVRNGDDVGERFDALRDAFRMLIRRRRNFNAGRRGSTFLARAQGGVTSIEIKRGRGSCLWHPHIHAMMIVDRAENVHQLQAELRREWIELTEGESCNVFVGDVHSRNEGDANPLRAAFAETFKYATKGREMTPADTYEAWMRLKGRRFVQSFGLLYAVDESDLDLADVQGDVAFELERFVYESTPAGYQLVDDGCSASTPM